MDGITYLRLTQHHGVRAEIERLLVLWCVTMHNSVTWPKNGWYRCRKCGRCYAVPWDEGDRLQAYASAGPTWGYGALRPDHGR